MTAKELLYQLERRVTGCIWAKDMQIAITAPSQDFVDGLEAIIEAMEEFINEQKEKV